MSDIQHMSREYDGNEEVDVVCVPLIVDLASEVGVYAIIVEVNLLPISP